ncbi:MAG: glycosyltransferase family 2 protein [Thermodesulfovibrionales bacterium]|nr:glycosyltransferase family 2 protein [Thermodesulfovibrionales bacterium]
MSDPQVMVLILSYNGKPLLLESVATYLKNDYQKFSVTVIDNGSGDGTDEYVRKKFPAVHLLRTDKNLGYSGGFNLGLEYAFRGKKADYALVSNNDVKADPKVIAELVKVALTDDKIGFVTGKVYFYDQPDVLQTVGKREDPVRWNGGQIGKNEKDAGQYDFVAERPFSDDIFTLVSKKLYDEIGGYDPAFFLQCEEYDWQARAKNAGYKIMYTPYARIWHKESMTIGKSSPLKSYYDARNPMIVILKYKSPTFFRRYFWLHFRKDVCASSIRVIFRNLEIKKAYRIWAGFLSGLHWGFTNKKYTLRHFI